MAKQTIESAVDVYWVDNKDELNANFTELYSAAGVNTTATTAELNYLDIATLGTGAASKAVVLDANGDYTWPVAGGLTYGVLKDPTGIAITAKAAEINTIDGVVNHLVGTYTPATGTCAVDFQLYEAGASADAIAEVRAGFGYISDSLGGLGTAITSVATLSKGTISTLVTGSVFFWVCNSSGHIDMTLTGGAGTKYVTLVFPNGKTMRSEACVIN